MILFPEHHFIMSFRFIVGRIAIEKGAFPVILPDERFKIFILDHRIRKPPGCLPDGVKAPTHIKGWQLKDVHPLP